MVLGPLGLIGQRRHARRVRRVGHRLAADPNVAGKNGRVFASWDLAEEYDADGTRPHFVRWLQEHMPQVAAGWKKADDGFYAYWGEDAVRDARVDAPPHRRALMAALNATTSR
jgi:hypothetical protein